MYSPPAFPDGSKTIFFTQDAIFSKKGTDIFQNGNLYAFICIWSIKSQDYLLVVGFRLDALMFYTFLVSLESA